VENDFRGRLTFFRCP